VATSFDEQYLLDVASTARALAIGQTKTRELLNDGAIRSVRIGRRRLVPRDAIEEYVARLSEGTNEKRAPCENAPVTSDPPVAFDLRRRAP
jgi:excisionase family DNA binding protein